MIEPVSVMSEAPARAIPKSVTFARPSSSTITLWGLSVAVDDPAPVGKARRLEDLDHEVDRPVGVERALLADDLLQRPPPRYSIAM